MQRINGAGIKRLAAIHRGFTTYDKAIYRNLPMWHIPIELRRRIPNLPLICDPSHIGGRRELIAPLSQQAMDLGFDGLIIESHCCPDKAWSDAEQQITPDVLNFILDKLVVRSTSDTTESLKTLREQIDGMDNDLIQLLSKRMRVSREIATYKKAHNLTVVQPLRYNEIIDKRQAQGVLCGMSGDFMKIVFEAIHSESVRQQIDVINK
jgi:chorismate mutase